MKGLKGQSYKYLEFLSIFLSLSIFVFQLSCSADSQFTKKLTAKPFIAELFGETTKTLAIDTADSSHVAWLGLEWAADYKFFKIEQITASGVVTVPETSGPTAVFQDIAVNPSAGSSGVLGSADSDKLLIRITYSPLAAIESEDNPHRAYLLIVYDQPDLGTVRVELNGLTRGIAEGKCNGDPTSMETHEYSLQTGTIELYICDVNGIPDSQVTPGAPGEKTNLTDVPVEGNFFFYQPDEETVCVVGADGDAKPTIPPFDLPIPRGISSATDSLGSLPVQMPDGFKAECSLADGLLLCDANVQLDVMGGGVPVTPLTLTNGSLDPVSRDCKEFGSIAGDSSFGGNSFTVVATGEVEANSNTQTFQIDGALVVAKIKLQK